MKRALTLMLTAVLLLGLFPAAAETAETRYVAIETAEYGVITAELYPDIAPVTVANFLKLVHAGFYDGLTFHRIIQGFMIQGGDPKGNGTGGSGEKIKGEFSANGWTNELSHQRGVLSMARSSDMNGASSQFFIVHADSPHLDGNYAAFGRVLSGMSAVDHICKNALTVDNNGSVSRGDQPVITAIREITREEAEAAVRAEAENGRESTLFRDPYSAITFEVPAGYNLNAARSVNGESRFEAEDGSYFSLYLGFDYWGRQTAETRRRMTDAGYSRANITTEVFEKGAFSNTLRVSEEALTPVSFNGYAMFRTELDGRVHYIGALDGCIVLFAENQALEAMDAAMNTLRLEP